jgi:hypothetical protein
MGKKMKTTIMSGVFAGLLTFAALAHADDTAALIDLDKKWGESQGAEEQSSLLLDSMIQIGVDGLGNKASMLAAAEEAEPTSEPYMAGDYKVQFLSDSIAVMVHSTPAPEPHWSMHVWQKVDGKWQVAATAAVPASED